MKTFLLIMALGCCSFFASAEQQIVTDTSQSLSTANRAILHFHFFSTGNISWN